MKNCKSFNVLLLTVVALLLLAQPVGAQGENPSATTRPATTVVANGPGVPGDVFAPIEIVFKSFANAAITFGIDLIIMIAMIGGIYKCLQGVTGGIMGMNGATGAAVFGIIGLVGMVIITFLIMPALLTLLQNNKPAIVF